MSGSQLLLLGGVPAAATPVDPYFYSVTSLLHGDGTNGGQNNTFLDSSSNNFTITRNGNTTQGSFSPFSQKGWSGYFDGSGDYCTLSSNASMDFGAGNFTIECFVNTGVFSISAGASRTIIGNSGNSYTMQLYIDTTSGKVVFGNTGSTNLQGTGTVADNQWHHIVVVRSGTGSNQTALFVDGQRQAVGTNSQNYSSGTIYLGAFDTGNGFWNGYISNLRIVKGTAVYDPTATTLTVPTTPLTAVSNTALLTLQSNRFLDNSTNAYTVTKAGDTSIQPFSPFNPTTAYSTSAVGGSGYFDGSGDYLTLSGNPTLTTNFTIEFWFYMPSWGDRIFVAQGGGAASFSTSNGVAFQIYSTSTTFYAQWSNGAGGFAEINTATSGIATNAWHHVAIGNNGTTTRVWIDGVSIGTNTGTPTWGYPTTRSTYIGYISYSSSYVSFGYMAGVRMVTSDVYGAGNTTITVPTAPPTAIANTQLLCNFTNGAIFDNAAVGDYETVGNAQISTSVKKYGTGSMSFDGTGDGLTTSASGQSFVFGTGDFTIEGWVYLNTSSQSGMIYDSRPATTSGLYPTIRLDSGVIKFYTNSATQITGSTLAASTWYHFAVCRVASQTKLFVNGTQVGSTYADTNSYLNGSARPLIGADGYDNYTGANYLNGYVDDLRITKGVGRYQYNFTPPTAALPDIGGTVTLTADPYYEYTTLLLPGNGTNGAQNNTFLDSSTNAFTITRNGNTTQGTFSPFSQTGWSNYFDGTGDYLTVADNAALEMGSSNFTIECWFYPLSLPSDALIVDFGSQGAQGSLVPFYCSSSSVVYYISSGGGTWNIASGVSFGGTLRIGQWHHLALVRNGNTYTPYFNGVAGTTTTNAASINDAAVNKFIGSATTGTAAINGYLSDFRVVKGTAVYTSNFTPPTSPLTAITNTSLLTCQSNRFIDNSTNAFAITRNGDVSVQAFSPFNPTASWSAATYGGSGYFDGSGDYLTVAATSSLAFGSGDYTIEGWFYVTGTSDYFVFDMRTASGIYAYVEGSTGNNFVVATSGIAQSNAGTYRVNAWNHFAFVRSGSGSNNTSIYLNGTRTLQGTDTTNYSSNTGMYVGARYTATVPFVGYISDFRCVKGTAVYSGATYTVPTAPLTAITNTSLLLNYTNAGIYDATSKNDLETVGNAQISTTQSKFGGSSMYFDGTGDYLSLPSRQTLALGSGDWTVEAWVYLTAAPVEFTALFCSWNYYTSGYNGNFIGRVSTSNLWTSFNGQGDQIAINGTYTWTLNAWTHMAWVRFGNTVTVYRNGLSIGTVTDTKNLSDSANGLIIGVNRTNGTIGGGSPTQYITGYVNDFRATPGIARYTSNFTPPTTAFLTL